MVSQLSKTSLGMPLGALLEEAALVSRAQVEIALRDQIYYNDLLIGEIFALRGWIKQETADFFAISLPRLRKITPKKPLGQYLQEAALLTEEQIKAILQEQKRTFVRFGALAVLQGYIKQQTLDFFIKYFFPEHQKDSGFRDKLSAPLISEQNCRVSTIKQTKITYIQERTYTEDDLEYFLDEDDFNDLTVEYL